MPNFGGSRLGFWFLQQPSSNEFSPRTELNFIVDSSGSLATTFPVLYDAITNPIYLPSVLVPYYGSQTIYNNYVKFYPTPQGAFGTVSDEAIFGTGGLNRPVRNANAVRVINILFFDESTEYGTDTGSLLDITSTAPPRVRRFNDFTSPLVNPYTLYSQDITALRSLIATRQRGFYYFTTIQFISDQTALTQLTGHFLYAVQNATLAMNPSTIRTRVEIDYAAPKSLVDYKDIYKTLYNINAYYPTVYTQHRYKIYITNLIVDLLTNEYGYVGLSRI